MWSDAIMIARGDLGVEIGDAQLPAVQKELIQKTDATFKYGVMFQDWTPHHYLQFPDINHQRRTFKVLDIEREAFLSLCTERKTLERIQHMLKTGKPLRN